MVVLVGAGVIGFPWLFETQPRPMATDVQVVQADVPAASTRDGGDGGGSSPSGRVAAGKVGVAGIVPPVKAVEDDDDDAPSAGAPEPTPAARPPLKAPVKDMTKESAKDVAKASPPAPQKTEPKEAPKETPKATPKEAPKLSPKEPAKEPAKEPVKVPSSVASPKGADDASSVRYVVQFGAFADVAAAHAARMKVERLGIKTYTQQIETPAGKRIRVRMGPYADRAEAEKVLATMRKAGLDGAVLTL